MARRSGLILCLLLFYGAWLWRHTGAYASGADQSGYLNFARLLAEGRLLCPQPLPQPPITELSSLAAIPLGFRPLPEGQMAPTYPIGLPLLLAIGSSLVGWSTGPHLVMLLHALAGVWLTWTLARRLGLEDGLAGLAALSLALSPQYLFNALHCMSDLPALVWTTAAFLAAWSGRPLISGGCFAMSVLIRPTCLVSGLALLYAVLRSSHRLRSLALFVLGGLPGAAFLLITNQIAYGQGVTSGYGNVGPLFRLSYLAPSLWNYLCWLPVTVGPLLAAWLAWPLAFRRHREAALLLTLWVTPLACVYALFKHTHETWWYLRFLLPIFPALLIGALQVVTPWLGSSKRQLTWALVTGLFCGYWNLRLQATQIGSVDLAYRQVARWTRKHFEPNSTVITMQMSGCLTYYTPFSLLRWDTMKADDWPRLLDWCERNQRPLYAVVFPFEIDDGALRRCPRGNWTQIGRNFDITMWRWSADPPRPGSASPLRNPN